MSVFDTPLSPVNETAKRVIAGGIHFENRHANTGSQMVQFADLIDRVKTGYRCPLPNGAKDWTGFRKGRITVIAYSHFQKPRNPKRETKHYWVVRCDCGEWEMRKQTTLRTQASATDYCAQCGRLEHLKHIGSLK